MRNQPPDAVNDQPGPPGHPGHDRRHRQRHRPRRRRRLQHLPGVIQPANGRTEVLGRSGPLHPQRAVHRRRSVHLHLLRHRRCQRQEGVRLGHRHRDRRQAAGGPEDRLGPARGLPAQPTVVVKGTTGTCDTAAKLTLNSAPTAATPVPVTGGQDGGFEASSIPAGTFVGPYVLKLHAVCSGTEKAVERGLTVEQGPGAATTNVTTPPPASRPTFQCSATTATPTTPTATRPAWPWRRTCPRHGRGARRPDHRLHAWPGVRGCG